MRTLRRTSVQSDTKERAEGQAALERVEVAMGERWTDVKKNQTEANNCEWQHFGQVHNKRDALRIDLGTDFATLKSNEEEEKKEENVASSSSSKASET